MSNEAGREIAVNKSPNKSIDKEEANARWIFLRMAPLIAVGVLATVKLSKEYFTTESDVENNIPIGNTGKSMSIIYGGHMPKINAQLSKQYEPSRIFFEGVYLINKPINELESDETLRRISLGFDKTNQQLPLEFAIKNNIPILLPDLTFNDFRDPQIMANILGYLLISDTFAPIFAPLYDKLVTDFQSTPTENNKTTENIWNITKLILAAPPISETLLMFSSNRRVKNTIRTINNRILPFIDTLKGQGRDIMYAAKMHMLAQNKTIDDDESVLHMGKNHILKPLLEQNTDTLYKLVHDNRHWLKMFYSHDSLCNVIKFTDIKNDKSNLSGKMEELLSD